MAKIFQKTVPANEKVLILAVREALAQQIQATDWTDLRIGFFLSICGFADPASDDVITGLADHIGTDPVTLAFSDRVAIGLTDSATGGTFLGYTNIGITRPDPGPPNSLGASQLVSSDGHLGTTNSDYWRWANSLNTNWQVQIMDSGVVRAVSLDGSQMHLVQNFAGGHAAGYATLVALRFTRDDPTNRANIITMSVKCDAANHNGDILYTSTPNATTMDANLEAFPTQVQVLGPVQLSQTPDTIYAYWPFTLSRLRIHAIGILKAG